MSAWKEVDAPMVDRKPIVCHVTTAHPADDVRIFERECRSLSDSGRYNVLLAATGRLPDDSPVSQIPLTSIPDARGARFISGYRKAAGLTAVMASDLWHFHDPELLPVALRLAKKGVPVVWDAHEDYVSQFSEGESKTWVPAPARGVVRAGLKMMLERIDKHAAAVIAATPTIAARYSNPRTVVVGNEARLAEFASCTPDFESRQILFTGTAGPSQLFEVVVEAVAMTPNTRLVVAGRPPSQEVWNFAQERLNDRITHAGWLDRAGLARTISQVALGLSTYADIPTNAENSPNKVFEFCAAGLPVIASPNASNKRLIGEGGGGFVARGFSAPAFARAIASALSDRQSWQSASSRGRVWAHEAGSWERSERNLLELYDSVLGDDAPAP